MWYFVIVLIGQFFMRQWNTCVPSDMGRYTEEYMDIVGHCRCFASSQSLSTNWDLPNHHELFKSISCDLWKIINYFYRRFRWWLCCPSLNLAVKKTRKSNIVGAKIDVRVIGKTVLYIELFFQNVSKNRNSYDTLGQNVDFKAKKHVENENFCN